MTILQQIKKRLEIDFPDVLEEIEIREMNEMRIFIIDGTFIDIWFSLKLKGRYAIHWERRLKDSTIYRHDNIPHKKWRFIKTFPKHFHNGSEKKVVDSFIHDDIIFAVSEFMGFVREKLKSE